MTKEIKKLKKKYGAILKFSSDDDTITAYCKKPTYGQYVSYHKLYQDNPYEALVHLFTNCVVTDGNFEEEFMYSAANGLVKSMQEDKAFTIDETPQEDDFKKSAALIRYFFHVDPYELVLSEFYKLLEEALWLQKHQSKRLEHSVMNAYATIYSN